MTELNTLLKLPGSFPLATLATGKTYEVVKEKERAFPLHIAILLAADDWTFLGYVVANKAEITDHKTKLTFTLISLFTPEEQQIYTRNFLTAAKFTKEV